MIHLAKMVLAQQVLPSQYPYSFLDYGVSALALIVLGIILWFVFKVFRSIMADQSALMEKLVESISLMKEELLTHIIDTRHLSDMMADDQKMKVWERTSELEKEIRATAVRHEEKLHREEQTRHVDKDKPILSP